MPHTKPVNFRTMDLNLLRVFDEVMQAQSLTRAADKLAITQPAVSNAMRRLRETLGDELLVRNGQGMVPTAFAHALWPTVRESLLNLQQSLAPPTFSAASANSSFVLAMADATASELIPPLVHVLEKDAPGVSIRVRPLTTRDPRQLLESGEADLALGYFPAAIADLATSEQGGASVAYQHQRLYDGVYVCVMSGGHPLAASAVTIDQYCAARHLLVSFSGRPYGFIDEALAALGRRRRVVLTVNQFFTAGRVVANSNLLTVLPRHFLNVTGMADRLVHQDLPFNVPAVHVDAVWHQRHQADPGHQWLRQTLHQIAGQVFAS